MTWQGRASLEAAEGRGASHRSMGCDWEHAQGRGLLGHVARVPLPVQVGLPWKCSCNKSHFRMFFSGKPIPTPLSGGDLMISPTDPKTHGAVTDAPVQRASESLSWAGTLLLFCPPGDSNLQPGPETTCLEAGQWFAQHLDPRWAHAGQTLACLCPWPKGPNFI